MSAVYLKGSRFLRLKLAGSQPHLKRVACVAFTNHFPCCCIKTSCKSDGQFYGPRTPGSVRHGSSCPCRYSHIVFQKAGLHIGHCHGNCRKTDSCRSCACIAMAASITKVRLSQGMNGRSSGPPGAYLYLALLLNSLTICSRKF